MTYSIVGSGKVGTALARLFARKNIDVAIANSRGADSIAPLANELKGKIRAINFLSQRFNVLNSAGINLHDVG